jgi:uncharacterized membrane protein (UPF0127 family)
VVLKKSSDTQIISDNLIICSTIWDKLLGLIIKKNCSLLLQTRWGIHTFFLKEQIDVLILNSDYEIVALKKNLNPNSVYFWNPKYYLVLELPSGLIEKNHLCISDHLKII